VLADAVSDIGALHRKSPTKTRTCSSWCFLASERRPVCPRCCWLAPIPNIPTRCVYRMCSLYSRKCRCVCIGYAFVCVHVFIHVFMLCMRVYYLYPGGAPRFIFHETAFSKRDVLTYS
jgi:hypothetical protein